jgi:predicted nuclease with TOPRIM domain
MKSAYKSVMFYIGQKELEMQCKMNKIVGQCRQKCEMMQEKFTEKLEQLHTAYQKMAKRCQMMQQEIESLTKDNQELQEKFAEKSRSVSITSPACKNQISSSVASKLFLFQAEEKIRWNVWPAEKWVWFREAVCHTACKQLLFQKWAWFVLQPAQHIGW